MSRMILNIRGTSGSGKTTIARTFMNNHYNETMLGKPEGKRKPKRKPWAVYVETPQWSENLYLVGKYDNVCGGMDGITYQKEQAERICDLYTKSGHVLCEGLLLSSVGPGATTPAAMLSLAGRDNVCFAFLDTPLELCIERVKRRREERGEDKPFNPANTIMKWEDCKIARERLIEAGYWVEDINHEHAYEDAYRIIDNYEKYDA